MIKTTGFSPMGDRYVFDIKSSTWAKGWAQLDTKQDDSDYGNWVNPTKLELVSHCEGDQTHIQCESGEEFVAKVREDVEWHGDRFIGIDGMCNPDIITAFTRLGLNDLLH